MITQGPATSRPSHAPIVARARLFFVSYAGLWAIFALQASSTVARGVLWGCAAAALLDASRLVGGARGRTSRRARVTDVHDRGTEVAGYMATYLLPFIGGPPTHAAQVAAYGVYFAVSFLVAVRSDIGLINPTLYLFRYRVAEGTVRGERVMLLYRGESLTDGDCEVARFMGKAGLLVTGRSTH